MGAACSVDFQEPNIHARKFELATIQAVFYLVYPELSAANRVLKGTTVYVTNGCRLEASKNVLTDEFELKNYNKVLKTSRNPFQITDLLTLYAGFVSKFGTLPSLTELITPDEKIIARHEVTSTNRELSRRVVLDGYGQHHTWGQTSDFF